MLVLCFVIWPVAGWSTLSSPTGSQPGDVPTLDVSDLSPVKVSAAEESKNPHTSVSLDKKDSTVINDSKAQSA